MYEQNDICHRSPRNSQIGLSKSKGKLAMVFNKIVVRWKTQYSC